MPFFLFGVLALVLMLFAMQAFTRANPAVMVRNLRRGAGVAALGGALFMFVRGAASLALPLAAFGAWLLWEQTGGRPRRGRHGPSDGDDGQVSRVTTDHLEMMLDHASGVMEGRVLAGRLAGRELSSLKPVELVGLWQDWRYVDPASAQLIEAYLDRVHASWRDDMARRNASMGGTDGGMSREEALELLGLPADADADAIRQAHRTLMSKLHPDRGGSTYLAAKINQAKDVALGTD